MTHSKRWLLVLSVSAMACGAVTGLYAQDDLEALLQDLGGQRKKPAAAQPAAPAAEAAPKAEAKPAEPAPAPAPAPAAEPKAEEKPAPAPAAEPKAEEKPAPAPAPAAEPKAEEKPAPAPAPAAEPKAEEKPAPAPAAEPAPAPAAEPAPAPAAEPAAAPAPATPAVAQQDGDTASLISELVTLETIRRKSLDSHGFASLEAARKALAAGDYELARDQYKQALEFIGNRPATQAARDEAKAGMAEAFYLDAKQAMKAADVEKALPLAAQAKEYGHPQAERMIEALKRQPPKVEADTSSISHRVNEEEYKTQRDEIRRRLRRSRQYYTTAEYDKAMEECELILRDHPYEVEAMELRDRIADRMKTVSDIEFEATRSKMIRDVRASWTPDRYAIDSAQRPKGSGDLTSKEPTIDPLGTKTAEQVVQQKLRDIVIPEVTFRPPATIIDAVDFFKQASRDFDKPEIPLEQRGVNLVLKLSTTPTAAAPAPENPDPFAPVSAAPAPGGAPTISALSARFISLYDALKLVCDVTGMKFKIRGNIVMIVPANEPDTELMTRSYNVLSSLTDRVTAAISEMGPQGGGGDTTFMQTADMGQKQDWKVFFEQLGVKWPDGSSISYLATIGKLRVTNTAEQLAVFEQVLEDLNVTPRLIEIEARFVEVAQEDLNSLGFEWLLNSDFSFDAGGFLDKALNMREFSNKPTQLTDAAGHPLFAADGETPLMGYAPYTRPGSVAGQGGYRWDGATLKPGAVGAGQYGTVLAPNHNASIDAIDGINYSTGQRYLSTEGNAIAGEGNRINDNFMRVNAFLGNADLSMILHMLSQRSDTDLLSAPKVVTKSGQEAIMKVVTEYIYPTEFEVQEVNTSGGSSTSSATYVPVPFMVEPQNFEMREVGVILQVVPEVSAEGQMINLLLNPQVVSEPVWKNYGTKIPVQNASSWSLPDAAVSLLSPGELLGLVNPQPEYTELPMEQPFFHVRSVQTQLSVYNGATVVMGGLITEDRKTMEDKIPFLGDLPFLGRLFRSRSEQSIKRNLLVFVTARLVDPAGRVVRTGGESALLAAGTPSAPSAPEGGAAPAPDAAVQ
jgi:general secretion pathway protein D